MQLLLTVSSVLTSVLVVALVTSIKYINRNYPAFCTLPGPNKFIGVSYHRVPNQIRFKLYYPSSESLIRQSKCRPPPYFKDGDTVAKGLHKFITSTMKGIPLCFFTFLSSTTPDSKQSPPPCFEGAPFHQKMHCKKLPVVLFSHGLGGGWDLYTQICCNLASFGLIVVMVEHDDGSAIHWKTANGEDHLYIRQHVIDENGECCKPMGSDWTRDHTQQFRGPQVTQRVDNMLNVLQFVSSKKFTKSMRKKMDFGNVFIAGHSFGGITAVCTAKKLRKHIDRMYKGEYQPTCHENE